MSDCIFCKIIAKEIPSTPVYEDQDVYAFLDIKPVNPGHTLVVPKKHCDDFLTCPSDILPTLILVAQKIGRAIQQGLGVEGFNLIQNNGTVAGQLVRHLHLHIIPRLAGDGLRHWPHKSYASDQEAEATAKKIRDSLNALAQT